MILLSVKQINEGLTMNRITNGKMKCNEKNRFNVALLIENPPQIHNTIVSPIYGIADKRLVITIDLKHKRFSFPFR